jgi:prolyl-tRNA synthetase
LLKAGYIRQVMAWVYTYTTLWLKVLRKIENIIREEMDLAWANEILMTWLSPKSIWDKTGRWDIIDVLFKLDWNWNSQYALWCTHEEQVTPLMKEFIQSYKDLDFWVYQIQNKFRNEKRAKSWLLRWREFLMKDLYSFHKTEEWFEEYYEKMKKVYVRIFERLWLWKDTYITVASWWDFTDKYSHEFQTVLGVWEDTIHICKSCKLGHNEEVVTDNMKCVECGKDDFIIKKASEIWNIFPLSTKFSNAFDLSYIDNENKKQEVIMWCYGIWISRIMWVIAEYYMNDNWINWPENIAPADYYIIVLSEENIQIALKLANKLEWKTVILDDRIWKKYGFWMKAWDAELFGIPNRIVVSPKTIEQWGYELTKNGKSQIIKL